MRHDLGVEFGVDDIAHGLGSGYDMIMLLYTTAIYRQLASVCSGWMRTGIDNIPT